MATLESFEAQRAESLRRTLRYAVDRVPFYRNAWHARNECARDPALSDFDPIDPAQIWANLDDMLALDEMPDYVLLTGGTTGVPTVTFRTLQEADAIFESWTGLGPGERFDTSRAECIHLQLADVDHYAALPTPTRGRPVLRLPMLNPTHGKIVRHLLEHGLPVGARTLPIGSVTGSLHRLKLLTSWLMWQGYEVPEGRMRFIGVYGTHLTEVWRQRLRDFWKCEATTAFGQTETNESIATQCPSCLAFHHQQTLHEEYFAPDRSGPVESGDAVLVLTTLVPFTKAMPRIRYWTNDLIGIGDDCPRTGRRGFIFLGRAPHCVVAREGEEWRCLLAPVDVVEVLDEIDEINPRDTLLASFNARQETDRFQPPLPTGLPAFTMQVEEGWPSRRVRILVETREGADGPRVRERLLDALHARLVSLEDDLREWDINLEVEILGPNGLAERGLRVLRA